MKFNMFKKYIYIYLIIQFQAIQTTDFYKKNMYEMFKRNLNMFPDLRGSCNPNKNKSQDKTDHCIRSKLELIPGGGFWPSDKIITEYYRYFNAHKDYNPWFK